MATLRSLVQDKMAATAMIVIFLCFGLLFMAWIRQRRRMRFRRRRRRPCAESLALLGLFGNRAEDVVVPHCTPKLALNPLLAPYLQQQLRLAIAPRSSFSAISSHLRYGYDVIGS